MGALPAVAWVVATLIQLAAFPVVVVVVVVVGVGYAASMILTGAWRVLSVASLSGPSTVTVPPASAASGSTARPAEPAYPSYVLEQSWLDLWVVIRRSAGQTWRGGLRVFAWLRTILVNQGVIAAYTWPTVAAVAVGTVLLAVPIAAGLATVGLLQATVAAAMAIVWMLVVGVLSLVEYGLRLVRRIVVACPHPGCYKRFGLPTYVCPAPGCGERHRRLVPGRYGALRHICRCGARLPTLVLLGRHRLAAQCPHCSLPLPGRIGRVRVEHVPIVGGPNAGKSTFLCLAVSALRAQVGRRGGTAAVVDARDERAITDGLARLRRGDHLMKTDPGLPRAVMLDVRPANADGRILYLFDPAGDHYTGQTMDLLRFLDHAQVAVVVVDPLAIPGVWRAFTEADQRVIATAAPPNQAGVARENPGDVVDRLVAALHGRPAGPRLARLLVIVSKTDVLRRTSVGAGLAERIPSAVSTWLEQVGWGNWIRALEGCTAEVAYLASGLDISDVELAEPVAWLSGISLAEPIGRHVSRRRAQVPRPWVSATRPGAIPLGHRVGRIATLCLVVSSLAALSVATIWYAITTLIRIYG
jgi:Double-GTPase 2